MNEGSIILIRVIQLYVYMNESSIVFIAIIIRVNDRSYRGAVQDHPSMTPVPGSAGDARDALTGEHREGLIAHAQIAPKDLKPLLCRILLPSRLAPVVDLVQNIKYLQPRNAVYRGPEIPNEQRCLSVGAIRGVGVQLTTCQE